MDTENVDYVNTFEVILSLSDTFCLFVFEQNHSIQNTMYELDSKGALEIIIQTNSINVS